MEEMLTTEQPEVQTEEQVEEQVEETAAETTTEQPAVDTQAYRDGAFRDILAGMDVRNPATGERFQSEQEWNEYLSEFQKQEQAKELQRNNIDPDFFNDAVQKAVDNNPTVQQAKNVIEQAALEQGQQAIKADLAEIAKYDPTVKDFAGWMAHPKFSEMNAMVDRGYSMLDAFKLANFDTISQKRVEAAKQGTMNQLAGKAHLTTTKGGVGSATVVPSETLAAYRQWFPDKSDEWIANQYKKFG